MLEALWYGSVAALTFIGFISLLYFLLLHIYRPKDNGNYILCIPTNASAEEILKLIYGAYLRNLIYGSLICKDIVIFDNKLGEEKKHLIKKIAEDLGGISYISVSDLETLFERKEENGTGIC